MPLRATARRRDHGQPRRGCRPRPTAVWFPAKPRSRIVRWQVRPEVRLPPAWRRLCVRMLPRPVDQVLDRLIAHEQLQDMSDHRAGVAQAGELACAPKGAIVDGDPQVHGHECRSP